jgi:hypothetical protein
MRLSMSVPSEYIDTESLALQTDRRMMSPAVKRSRDEMEAADHPLAKAKAATTAEDGMAMLHICAQPGLILT